MGLDLVEIAIGIEEEFGVGPTDDGAARICTAGDLHRCIVKRLAMRDAHPCLGAMVFYRLRATLVDRLGIPREKVCPKSELRALIPRWRRRAVWQEIGRVHGLDMPPLVYPLGIKLFYLIVLVGAVLLLVGSILGAILWGFPFDFFVQFAVAAAAGALLLALALACLDRLTTPLRVRFPKDCATVKEAVRAIVRRSFGDAQARARTWSDDEVWDRLRQIVAHVAGIEPEQVTREAELVRDLGLQ